MASEGPNSPDTISTENIDIDWINPNNVKTSNNTYTTITFTAAAANSDWILASVFEFAIPSDATITDTLIEVEYKKSSTSNVHYMFAGLIVGGVRYGSETGGQANATSDTYKSFNFSTALTPAQVNASNFGASVRCYRGNWIEDFTVYIDHIRITISYTCPTVIISTTTLPDGGEGEAYSETISATPASGITWTIVSGALPTGITINSSTGVISGTPTSIGIHDFTVRATISCGSSYDDQAFTVEIAQLSEEIITETVSSVTETITCTTSTFDVSMANNNQAYILNRKTGYWTFQDTAPFTNAVYRPSTQKILASRRDLGQIVSFESDDFAGTPMTSIIQTGYMNLGEFDEIKAMEDKSSEAIKRLRAFFADCKGEGDLTLTIYTENDSTGETFTVPLATTDNDTLNAVRIALSRSLHGKYIAFKLTNTSGNDFFVGEMRMKILPKAIR